MLPNFRSAQENKRRSQLIPLPSNPMDGKIQFGLKVLELLPNRTATNAQGSTKRFSGMETAIFQKF
ncbi:hypothetical protein ALP39_02938 [Pseudomonas marginalis pv. marginalis]|nr:hypothetical protein ALP39_02938 [Pseudomonas marginalis pv. marginalis]